MTILKKKDMKILNFKNLFKKFYFKNLNYLENINITQAGLKPNSQNA